MKPFELQKAIYTKLDAALSVPVYDDVPQGASYPYVVIGEDATIEWDTDTEIGSESTLTIHTWSRAAGRKQTKELQEAIYTALHRTALVVTGVDVITCTHEFSESFMDPDGETRHGVSRYRVLIEL